jgi:hypothetical protein
MMGGATKRTTLMLTEETYDLLAVLGSCSAVQGGAGEVVSHLAHCATDGMHQRFSSAPKAPNRAVVIGVPYLDRSVPGVGEICDECKERRDVLLKLPRSQEERQRQEWRVRLDLRRAEKNSP